MNKPTKRSLSVVDLKVDQDLNIRLGNNYDIPTMKEQIIAAGRILKPIIVRGEDLTVLSGNRRTLAGQELFQDKSIPVDLKEALSKVDVIVYSGLSQQEQLGLILDHGSEKPIARTEVVMAVWRMDAQFYSEAEIIRQLHYALARYSGNEKKLKELPDATQPKARELALRKWFHGTVGNYMLAAAKMGPYIRDQFILTHKAEDGLLTEGERVELRCSRDRITQLSAAKTKDLKENGGWSCEAGGPAFNELIEQFKAEDKGESVKERSSRPSVKELRDKADVFKSDAFRAILRTAAGDKVEGLLELDDETNRQQLVIRAIAQRLDNVPQGQVTVSLRDLLSLIAVSNAERVSSFLDKSFPVQ